MSPNGSPDADNPAAPTPQHEENDDRKRSTRKREPISRLMEAMLAETSALTVQNIEGEIFCLQALYPERESPEEDAFYAYKATADPDTMYMHQAMKEPDRDKFVQAMEKEWKDQYNNGNFSVMLRSKVPKDKTILLTVWQMRRKRDIKTREVKKYKARLNIDGARMKPGVDYDQTYAPVASWNSIRTLLAMTVINKWHTKQLDYVLAFPQAPVEREIYMTIPKGFEIEQG